MPHGTSDYTSEELMEMLEEIRENRAREAHLARRCYVCGEPDEDNGGKQGYLTQIEVCIARGQEDHSESNRWLCEHHMRVAAKVLTEVGLGSHYHSGFNWIERNDCGGYVLPYDCPEPEDRNGGRT